jgi:hypothetical protein
MAVKFIKLSGTYIDWGKIRMSNGHLVAWHDLVPQAGIPDVPYGTKIEMTITYQQSEYLHGKDGIVWATHDRHQAEVICGTLRAQDIACEVREKRLQGTHVHLIRILLPEKVAAAIDFIWRDGMGLRLKPDWRYPSKAENESFQRWVSGL